MSSRAYISSDDSALLRSVMQGRSGRASLEMGAGNGGGLIELAQGFVLTVGTDLKGPARGRAELAGADFVVADAASCFRERVFDLVAFNPPYVPTERIEDATVDGGVAGSDISLHFLREALRVVREDGKILMLLSSDNPIEPFGTECKRLGFRITRITEKRLFYETLSVYEASRKR